MDNTQRVIFDNNPHVRLRDIFDTAFQHRADDLMPLNEPRKNFVKIFSEHFDMNKLLLKMGTAPNPHE